MRLQLDEQNFAGIDFNKFIGSVEKEIIFKDLKDLKIGLEKVREEMMEIIKNLKQLRGRISPVRTELRTEVRTEPKYFETEILKRAKKTRPELIKKAISKLLDENMKVVDIERYIVKEKELCGRTQFYHYLGLVRSSVRTELRTKNRTEGLNREGY